MSSRDSIREDLEPGATPDLIRLAERMHDERPLPGDGFREGLRATLGAPRASELSAREARKLIAACALSGTLLLALAAAITFL